MTKPNFEVKLTISRVSADLLYYTYQQYKDGGKVEKLVKLDIITYPMKEGMKGFMNAAAATLSVPLAIKEMKDLTLIEEDESGKEYPLTTIGLCIAKIVHETHNPDD